MPLHYAVKGNVCKIKKKFLLESIATAIVAFYYCCSYLELFKYFSDALDEQYIISICIELF